MTRILRFLTTLMIGIGIFYLFFYIHSYYEKSLTVLFQPSYYTQKSFKQLFLLGIITIAIALAGCFLSWFRKLDPEKRELPNAIAAKAGEIDTWLTDSTLNKETVSGPTVIGYDKTELIDDETIAIDSDNGDKNEASDANSSEYDKTVLIDTDEKTLNISEEEH